MALESKLRENYGQIVFGSVLGFAALIILIVATRQLEEDTAHQVIGGIWMLFALIQLFIWLRTKNSGYMIWMITCILISLSYFTDSSYFMITAAILIVAYLYLLASRRMRWRYRDILELAARPVDESRDGFTARPFPAGKAEYSPEDLARFGRHLSKNLVAFPFYDDQRALFLIRGSTKLLFRRPKTERDTFVAFDYAGNISVNIAERDYRQYRSELTFDQLCASLGNLFKTFLRFYQEGKKDRIVAMIDEQV